MMKKILFIFSAIAILSGCSEKIKAKKGRIDIISNIYFEASKNLENVQSIQVSKLNFKGDTILEIVPAIGTLEMTEQVNVIIDTTFYGFSNENSKKIIFSNDLKNGKSVYKKTAGALYTKENITNYVHRRDLNDTTLFKKKYKRFEIETPLTYSVFYIYKTDTILPYSIYPQVEKDYSGRIERIDSYNKKKDIFVTLQMILNKNNWDAEAQDIFDFNQYLSTKK